MKKASLVGATLVLLLSFAAGTASAGEPGCLHCKLSHIQGWLGKVHPGCACHYDPIMTGNCAFGQCGKGKVPGPWYTYWPYNGYNLSSPYESASWTYLNHFQTPAPLGGGSWHTHNTPYHGGFGGVPYYWQGR
jgi:hypothetical protein